jgi:hypothetical protein
VPTDAGLVSVARLHRESDLTSGTLSACFNQSDLATNLPPSPPPLQVKGDATGRPEVGKGPRPCKRQKHDGLQCTIDGCSLQGTFPRQCELDRHVAAQHNHEKKFECPVFGCLHGPSQTSFTRADKLTSHIRSCHARDIKVLCPWTNCRIEVELEVLGIHLERSHHGERVIEAVKRGQNGSYDGCPFPSCQEYLGGKALLDHISGHDQTLSGQMEKHSTEEIRLLQNASSAYRKCLLWSCRKPVALSKLMDHQLQHAQDQLRAAALDLWQENYALIKSGCDHCLTDQSCNCAITGIAVVCPICHAAFSDHDSLERHIDDVHIVGTDQSSHLNLRLRFAKGYCKQIKGQQTTVWKANERFSLFQPWQASGYTFLLGSPFSCPCCQQKPCCQRKLWSANHHLSLLGELSWLKPYRLQILSLYPDFAHCPQVWDDLA